MAWDERQAAMLAEMGIRLWPPTAPGVAVTDAAVAGAGADATGAARRVDAGGAAGDAGHAGDAARRAPGSPARTSAPPTTGLDPQRGAPGGGVAAGLPGAVPGPEAGTHGAPGIALAASFAEPDSGRVDVPPSGPERAAAIARLDWPTLAEAVAHCSACALCRVRGRTVFGVGHPQAHCMVVGEAPGEQEDRQGEPFVGKAGQLLDAMLRAIGLGRDGAAEADDDPARRVYIANVLKCRPPHNRNPAPDEVALCEPFLRRQIALVRPRVILALGRYAVGSLLASDAPIGRLRGRVHEVDGVPTVVSYHPAYLLRNPADKARAWDDLCLARELLHRGEPPAPSKRGSDRAASGA